MRRISRVLVAALVPLAAASTWFVSGLFAEATDIRVLAAGIVAVVAVVAIVALANDRKQTTASAEKSPTAWWLLPLFIFFVALAAKISWELSAVEIELTAEPAHHDQCTDTSNQPVLTLLTKLPIKEKSILCNNPETLAMRGAVIGSAIVAVYFALGILIRLILLLFSRFKTVPGKYRHMPMVADTTYYLGFIITLLALTSSLYRVDFAADVTFSMLIQNNALALISTIVGLILRTSSNIFTSPLPSALATQGPSASPPDVLSDFGKILEAIKAQVQEFSTSMQKFSESVKGAGESAGSIGTDVREFAKEITTLVPILIKMGEDIKDSNLPEFVEAFKGLLEPLKEMSKEIGDNRLADYVTRGAKALAEGTQRLEQTTTQMADTRDIVAGLLEEAVKDLKTAVSALAAYGEELEKQVEDVKRSGTE